MGQISTEFNTEAAVWGGLWPILSMPKVPSGMQLIDPVSAAQFIRAMASEWTWLLQHIESEDGYVRFPPLFSRLITNLKIENYPALYENESSIGVMMARAFLSPEEFRALDAELTALNPEDRAKRIESAISSMSEAVDVMEIPKTPAEQKRAEKVFNAMTEEDQKASIEFLQRFMMAFLASFYQSLSIMVHGEKLTSLVAQAKAGDDKAFARAVQIDKRILFAIPYFKQRFADAHTDGNRKFTEDVAAHLERPPYKGKIRHKSLYLAFAFLDMAGLLRTMKHKELLDLCDEAGIGGYANRIEDLKNFSKRLAEFHTFQRRGLGLSTP